MSQFSSLFAQLDADLSQTRAFWQFMPFAQTDLAWRTSHPELCEWLMGLSDEELQFFNHDVDALATKLSQWIPQAMSLQSAAQTKALASQPVADLPKGLDVGIPGRKWTQITAFNAALPRLQLPWLEWCAGKGHLGRVLAASHHTAVTSLEWQAQLCLDGEKAVKALGLPISFVNGDAFSTNSEQYIQPQQHAVALHACGDLHVSLLQRVAKKQGQAVSVSPCCYHLIRGKQYQPLSQQAKASDIQLAKHDLRLPLQETVTAGQRVQRQRFVEVSFRLGFDALQRHLSESEQYLPVPNVQKALLNEGFAAFCQWAADKKGLTLPADIDYEHWQQVGEQRFSYVDRMELVRQLFRRPLEMWLVYDRACFMEESGYQVSVGTFCDKPTTPRNLLIHAELAQG
ncbi:SAM-dependent methyltransferase [Photobacterium jeanii]|uniref:SAM-dependent methyltransferase n=1 Tax=Photobacterium jeanii TaxID=858640 RepID=A0A178KLQ3_9GAMM|nr:methyltransferase [Photobacterium jeanii]OAN18318.1 SAM-dependent methyltransferase [Photobacterium jeanii]PST92002.1 methyltransferase [Photobacterium jeanii]